MKHAYPSNRMIGKALSLTLPELVKRYGRDKDCTKEQLVRTCADLNIADEIHPYLCAACLSAKALALSTAEAQDVNWEEVKNRATRMAEEYTRNRIPFGDRFYESGIGMTGEGAANGA